jgi:hypothetical protein
MSVRLKVAIALVLLAIVVVPFWWFYGPEHLFVRVADFVTVTVDDRCVRADAYIAHPTYDESDAILLVTIPGQGNYLFNFGALLCVDRCTMEIGSRRCLPAM